MNTKIPKGYKKAAVQVIAPKAAVQEILEGVQDEELARRIIEDPHLSTGIPQGVATVATLALMRGLEALRACYYPEPYQEDHPEAPTVTLELSVHGAAALHHFARKGLEASGEPMDSSPEAATKSKGRGAIERLGNLVRVGEWKDHTHWPKMRVTEEAKQRRGEALVLSDDGGVLHYRLQRQKVQEGDTLEFFYLGKEWVLARFHWGGVLGQRPRLYIIGETIPWVPMGEERLRWPGEERQI